MSKEKRMYSVSATVTGSKYIGEFEASSEEEARKMAEESDEMYISLCHQCSSECEDAEINEIFIERVVITKNEEGEE